MAGIETVNFAAGMEIFKEGDKPDGVYFILSGGVDVSRLEGGSRIVLAKLGADAVFGEMALIDSQPRSATVTASIATQCMKGTDASFANLMSKVDPAIKKTMQDIVTIIREKNKARKAKMTPQDMAVLTAQKQKAEQLKAKIFADAALLSKIKTLDPFLNGVFNSLMKLLLA